MTYVYLAGTLVAVVAIIYNLYAMRRENRA